MAHFAKVNKQTNIVEAVIVATQSHIFNLDDSEDWVQTSYNTIGGQHKTGGVPLRKNFAAVGYTYDRQRDAFYAPKPYSSWTLNEDTCQWQAPTTMPDDGKAYSWNESTTSWNVIE